MKKPNSRSFLFSLTAIAALAPSFSFGADGYFLTGYGPRQRALGGAGVADSRDPMAMSINPAGIVGLEREFQIGIAASLPERGYSTIGQPAVLAPGDVRSGRPIFPVPNAGYVHPIDADSAWGVANYGNGGLNTAYDFGHFKPPVKAGPGGAITVSPSFGGVLGGGWAGLDLQQSFMSATYARRFGPITVGFAPTLAIQMFNAQGLKILSPYSSNMYNFSDMAYDWSVGGGFRVGVEWRATNELRFGLAGATPMFMSKLQKYRGLIADQGSFDIPATLIAGVAYDVLPNVTLMADWRHIFYSATTAGNASFPIWYGSFGSSGGAGFDWRDTDSASFGAEWRTESKLTLRVGYHYSTLLMRERSATLAALAPLVGAHAVTGGFGYQLTKNSSIDFAALYDFKNSVSYYENAPFVGRAFAPAIPLNALPHYNTNAVITAWGRATQFTVGYNYKWDAGDTSWIPSHF
ncbi:OmpP1/FadL family transporter [Methylocystis sp. SC2]|uniref:OmpP1/FadL family transporter n=1 Tax=Methylocystis sp. (strain SC2) TaxID=187303 RepID=UPI00027AEDFB|nr:outer membrane protein transport protein [Methylocystis sp. SC2]CCJ05770.1 Membrane protein involved in aromatic hydrocarbon degradation [Methylocystis sp. SC2]